MALTPQTNEAFLREVDEELRRDQLEKFGRRWGKWLAIALVAALLVFAGVLYWLHARDEKAGREGEQLSALLNDLDRGNDAKAPATLAALAQSSQPGYRSAAILLKADLALSHNDVAAAAKGYQSVIDDDALPKPYRDAALVRLVAAEFDTMPPDQVIARLKPLAAPGNPWFGSAGEMSAVAYLKLGKPNQAGPIFAAVARDKLVPDSIRNRAAQIASGLGIDAGVDMGEAR